MQKALKQIASVASVHNMHNFHVHLQVVNYNHKNEIARHTFKNISSALICMVFITHTNTH